MLAQNQQLVFGGKQEVNYGCEGHEDGEEVAGENFLERNVYVYFVELNVLDVHEVRERDLINPTGLQEGLRRLDWNLLEPQNIQVRLSSLAQQLSEGLVEESVYLLGDVEEVHELIEERLVFIDQSGYLLAFRLREAQGALLDQQRLNFLAETLQKLERILSLRQGFEVVVELGMTCR